MRVPLFSFVTAVALASAQAAVPEGWTADFAKAKAEAASSKKDLLLDFTGSDWCSWCIRLRKEVFDLPAFKEAAPKDFVLVELDFPQDKERISPETSKQNEALQAQYSVKGYPTIYLADAEGRPYAQTGYQKGGADEYLKHLASLKEIRVKRDAAFAKASGLSGVEKAAATKEGLDALGEDLVAVHYKETLKQIKELDPKDTLGVDAKFGYVAALAELDGSLVAKRAAGGDALRAVADEFLAKYPKATPTQKQQALLSVLNYLAPPKDNAAALKLLGDVKALDPDSETGKQAASIMERVQKMMEAEKGKDAPAK
ncbi:MAG: thioredoxin family protein [Verrucomicrobiota bacterium]